MRKQLGWALAALCLVGRATPARAGGFELYEESPSGVGMAGALTALPLDASAIFYNPAGIAMRPGGSALAGVGLGFGFTTATLPAMGSQAAIATSAQPQLFVLPEVYVAQHISPRWAAGIGMFTQFGNGIRWNDTGTQNGMSVPFPGRFLATNTQVQTVTINPTVAFKVNDFFSIGAGLDILLASVELQRQLQLGDVEASSHLGGTAQGVGGNVGVLAQPIPDRLMIGFSYRTGIDLSYGLQAHFDTTKAPELQGILVDQNARLDSPNSVSMPHNFSFGVAARPILPLTISVDVHHTLWQSLQQLTVTFQGMLPPLSVATNWESSTSVRLGLQYVLLRSLALRAGFGYEKGPVPESTLDPTAPVSDRWLATAGVAYSIPRGKLRGFGGGVSWIGGFSTDRASTKPDFPAVYSQNVHLVSVAVHYEWGTGPDYAYGIHAK